jgi:hypothetical protein
MTDTSDPSYVLPPESGPVVTEPVVTEPVMPGLAVPEPSPPPPPISLLDILNSVEMLRQKEAEDKVKLDAIGATSAESLRPALITWATRGLPNAYPLMEIVIQPPAQCSDGVSRSLTDYIGFCSGQPMESHVAQLQAKLDGMIVMYANLGHAIGILVSKA